MSTQILAFNTTTELCSVALMIDQCVYNVNIMTPKRHAEKILSMIDQLLSEVGITLQSLDYIIVDRGPGSFVGVRIGISVAQGLALGADLPLVGVSSLVVLAQGARRFFKSEQIITTIDAHIGALYWAFHFKNMDNWVCEKIMLSEIEGKVCIRKLINSLQGDWVLVGTGWNNYSSLMYIIPNDPIVLRSLMFPEAQDMFPIGIYKWKNKLFTTPDKIKPIYLYNQEYNDKRYKLKK